MTWEQAVALISIVIAIYGAIISTILGVRELQKERRKIKIILEYVSFYEYGQLIVVNTGHRPITLIKINLALNQPLTDSDPNKKRYWDEIRANHIFDGDEPFPVTIEDGEQFVAQLSSFVSPIISGRNTRIRLHLFDAEGNVYTKFERRENNPKWGRLEKI